MLNFDFGDLQVDPDLTNRAVSSDLLPVDLKCGPVVTSCGHVMHSSCYQKFFDNLVRNYRES